MSQGVGVVGLYVRDQDEALEFYVGKLGFRVHTDARNGDYRWLTVPSGAAVLPARPVRAAASDARRGDRADGARDSGERCHAAARAHRRRLPCFLRTHAGPRRRVHARARGPLWHRGCQLPRSVGERLEDDPGAVSNQRAVQLQNHRSPGVNTMANNTPTQPAKVARKTTSARPVAAQAAKPRKAVAKAADAVSASQRIDEKIASLHDWRGERLAEIRKLIHEVDPDVVEEWKWMGTPVWSHEGMYALANPHKGKVKLTFFHGAQLPDPKQLFNAGLGSNWRAMDIFEGDKVDKTALKALLRAAVAYNTTHAVPKSKGSRA